MAQTRTFKQGATESFPANANVITDSISVSNNYVFVVDPKSSGIVGGPPTYTLEVSTDGVEWEAYSGASGLAIGDSFEDSKLAWTFVRINYAANGTTAGTVSFSITVKKV